jgi:hypothetical protein
MNKLVIELGGKERTLKFNNIFAREYEKKKLQYNEDSTNLGDMLYAGIKAYSVVSETKMEETYEECCDLADDILLNHAEKMQEILTAFQESTFYKAGQEVKKKIETGEMKIEALPIGMQLSDTLMVN